MTARLLGTSYRASQMTYDLRRLRLNGLIRRIEHTHTYVLTPEGQRLAIFYTKLHDRLLKPLAAADQPPAPLPLRHALATIDQHVDDYITQARLKPRPEPDSRVQILEPKDLVVIVIRAVGLVALLTLAVVALL